MSPLSPSPVLGNLVICFLLRVEPNNPTLSLEKNNLTVLCCDNQGGTQKRKKKYVVEISFHVLSVIQIEFTLKSLRMAAI